MKVKNRMVVWSRMVVSVSVVYPVMMWLMRDVAATIQNLEGGLNHVSPGWDKVTIQNSKYSFY